MAATEPAAREILAAGFLGITVEKGIFLCYNKHKSTVI